MGTKNGHFFCGSQKILNDFRAIFYLKKRLIDLLFYFLIPSLRNPFASLEAISSNAL